MRMVFAGLGLAGLAVFIPVRTLAAENDVTIVRKPTSIGMGIEMGQIVNGEDWDSNAGQTKVDVDMAFLQRLSIGITESAIVKEKLYLKAGVGGMFWYSFPRKLNNTEDNLLKFGPGITEASAKYVLGETTAPNFLKVGLFPFKYNPDATNLGEYLFRSGTYPGYVWNGGWGITNSAAYFAQGLHVHTEMAHGRFTQDLTLFMERDFAPYFDFTPSFLLGFKSAPVDLGLGISFNHLFAKPSRLAPKSPLSNYVKFAYLPATVGSGSNLTGDTVLPVAAGPRSGLEAQLNQVVDAAGSNPAKEKLYTDTLTRKLSISKDDAAYIANPGAFIETDQYRYARTNHYLTFRGIKLMARASFDPKVFFPNNGFKPTDFKIFAEAAILGIENQPVYFDNILQRIPVMFGVHLPGFRVFDSFTVQGEYHNSPFEEYISNLQLLQLPVWKVLGTNMAGQVSSHKAYTKDDWKWSVVAKRNVVPGLAITLQAASDHLRTITKDWLPGLMPLTNAPDQWYYMLRLDYGI